jgi:2-polyprenyl-6-methoxyphenol hydroxylase-like FAD-dependent oxidoreductase
MDDARDVVFARLVAAGPPERPRVVIGTACVLGGSIAGLLAARVLAGHAEQVVLIERDPIAGQKGPRPGVPQGRQLHALLPGGLLWMRRWFPGFAEEMSAAGAFIAEGDQIYSYQDGQERVRVSSAEHQFMTATRPFLEAGLRDRVLGLPNVSLLQSQVTGLEYQGDEVRGVRHRNDGVTGVLAADLVVDAMGRASRLADWLGEDGFDRPALERLTSGIDYATALFKRPQSVDELMAANVIARYGLPYPVDGVAIGGVNAVEDGQWVLGMMAYDGVRPPQTLDALRAISGKMPSPLFTEAASQDLTQEIATYHQADSRRRDFTGLGHFPAGLLSVGDAVASFNPIYGQGMTSAALHASCLSEYLSDGPDLRQPASRFFALQRVVVDAAWAVSAGGDAARLDALSGAEVPEEVSLRRQAMDQIVRASIVDATVASTFLDVAYMLAHPGTLADPELVRRAIAVNQG